MKKTLQLPLLITALCAIVSCRTTQHAAIANPPNIHTSQLSLDWAGVYRGEVLTVRGERLAATLTLQDNTTFSLRYQEEYSREERPNEFQVFSGSFHWDVSGRIIHLDGALGEGFPPYFMVQEGRLLQVSESGDVVNEDFVLLKQ
ncbi:MAG: copper resistance protein NlpE [Bacteroidales bacterium]|nr:copper resistance protein NlpE [Bacteroidales bacterium]